jgi:hypothetical protein
VAFHRFKIGQQVVVTAFGVHTGPYEITRLMPLVAGGPYYRAKNCPTVLKVRSLNSHCDRCPSQPVGMEPKLRSQNPGVAKSASPELSAQSSQQS